MTDTTETQPVDESQAPAEAPGDAPADAPAATGQHLDGDDP